MKFIGIDLGWRSQPSGLCCLDWQSGNLELVALERVLDFAEILAWVDQMLAPTEDGVVAVDAPTLIPNATGMRVCDRLTHKYFGKYHAGCYPANLGSPFAEKTLAMGRSLETRGFCHAPESPPRSPGRYQLEVFPHPATVNLFGLDQIIKYKKGRIRERQAGLSQLRHYILATLPTLEPRLNLRANQLPEIPTKGADLKHLEDRLDSLICAYVAAHWWYWGLHRNWVLGTPATGYIVVPIPPTASPSATAILA